MKSYFLEKKWACILSNTGLVNILLLLSIKWTFKNGFSIKKLSGNQTMSKYKIKSLQIYVRPSTQIITVGANQERIALQDYSFLIRGNKLKRAV